jgi:hypothetical protein
MRTLLPLRRRLPLAALAALAAAAPAAAEPPVARHLVVAVADASQPRILVRWNQLEGARRFTHYDLLRRRADLTDFATLNAEPLGPLATASEIETVFGLPGRTAAKESILATFGADYANDLLALQNPAPGTDQELQARLLPDLNYGAAVALGLGFIDEPLPWGDTYVYEVWGLDAKGFRVERLGRASATVGSPELLPAPAATGCADVADASGHGAAFVRWDGAAVQPTAPAAGYDVYRVRRNADGTCPPVGPGVPTSRKANAFPVQRQSHGRPEAGKTRFQASCASCHAGGRDAPPAAGWSIEGFYRRTEPSIWPSPAAAAHDTPALHALDPKAVEEIFDYLHEFQFRDGGEATPAEPVELGATYCYQVRARDLFGQPGAPAPIAQCPVKDRLPPTVPLAMKAARVPQGVNETCQLSWDRNTDDGTVRYDLYRVPSVPRFEGTLTTSSRITTITQPASGARVTHLDAGLGAGDAGESFYYAARAIDAAGNVSGFSGWAPCIPRDLVAPGAATLQRGCPKGCTACVDRGGQRIWTGAGGDPDFLTTDPRACGVEFSPTAPGDPFRYRVFRSFDGVTYEAGEEVGGPFEVDFTPTTDTPVWIKVVPLDKSGNLGPESSPLKFISFGLPLPAPQIVSVASVGDGRIKIRFRSLKRERLLGFSLARQVQGPDDAQPSEAESVFVGPQANLGGLVDPGQYAVKAGARALAEVSGFTLPGDPVAAEFLYYNEIDDLYVLQVAVGDLDDLVLSLRAIGWSGREGMTRPYPWDGEPPVAGVLAWPEHRRENTFLQQSFDELTLGYAASPPRITLSWTANPQGCNPNDRPFVVFRRRGGGRWQQISPPFVCPTTGPNPAALSYTDTDVEPGMSYSYTVVRTTESGEFLVRFGTTSITAP